ncbi:MAG: hypothetical protein R2823_09405 [Acidimicrobiia bacterium]
MRTTTWNRVAAISIIALAVAACSNGSTTTTEPRQGPDGGPLADYMNSFDASHLGGVELRRDIVTDRLRVRSDTEERFVAAVNEDSSQAIASATFAVLDDDAVIYLGYLYCLARDAAEPIDRSVAAVVDVTTRTAGRNPTSPDDSDFIAAVTIVNHASGSLCPERFVDTNAFLKDLTGSQ